MSDVPQFDTTTPAGRLAALRASFMFGDLSDDELMPVAAGSEPYRSDGIMWKEGEPADFMVLVLQGSAMPGIELAARTMEYEVVGDFPLWEAQAASELERAGKHPALARSGDVRATPRVMGVYIPYNLVRPLMPRIGYRVALIRTRQQAGATRTYQLQ